MVEEHPHGDVPVPLVGHGEAGEIPGHRGVQVHLARLAELKEGGGGVELADRADAVEVLVGEGAVLGAGEGAGMAGHGDRPVLPQGVLDADRAAVLGGGLDGLLGGGGAGEGLLRRGGGCCGRRHAEQGGEGQGWDAHVLHVTLPFRPGSGLRPVSPPLRGEDSPSVAHPAPFGKGKDSAPAPRAQRRAGRRRMEEKSSKKPRFCEKQFRKGEELSVYFPHRTVAGRGDLCYTKAGENLFYSLR